MQSWAQDSYLTTEVMTASPQRLQLMLIDAAIRFAERGRLHWQANENEQACESLIRAQDIISHILGTLRTAEDRGLAKKIAAVYVYIFRSLTEANLRHDEQKLNEALRVLEVERGTWRQVCEQLGTPQGTESPQAQEPLPPASTGTPKMPALDLSSGAGESYTGFSLEA